MKIISGYPKPRYLVAVMLVLGGYSLCATDTSYQVKVVVVDSQNKRLEAKFAVVPQDFRIICRGDTKGQMVGDYVKVEIEGDHFKIGKMECREVAWLH